MGNKGCDKKKRVGEEFALGGRVPRARLLPLPSLRSVQWLQLVLFPLESPPSAHPSNYHLLKKEKNSFLHRYSETDTIKVETKRV